MAAPPRPSGTISPIPSRTCSRPHRCPCAGPAPFANVVPAHLHRSRGPPITLRSPCTTADPPPLPHPHHAGPALRPGAARSPLTLTARASDWDIRAPSALPSGPTRISLPVPTALHTGPRQGRRWPLPRTSRAARTVVALSPHGPLDALTARTHAPRHFPTRPTRSPRSRRTGGTLASCDLPLAPPPLPCDTHTRAPRWAHVCTPTHSHPVRG